MIRGSWPLWARISSRIFHGTLVSVCVHAAEFEHNRFFPEPVARVPFGFEILRLALEGLQVRRCDAVGAVHVRCAGSQEHAQRDGRGPLYKNATPCGGFSDQASSTPPLPECASASRIMPAK